MADVDYNRLNESADFLLHEFEAVLCVDFVEDVGVTGLQVAKQRS